jgi:exonuclease VII small subunit
MMTEVNQHQMPLRHVIDNAEKAIQIANDAEMAVRHAQLESNPRKLASSVQQLETAQRAVQQAQSQISEQEFESNRQVLQQVQEQLTQAQQSMDVVSSNTEQPKQVR